MAQLEHPVFQYRDGQLSADGVRLADAAAEFGTPLFVYSASAIRSNYRRIVEAFARVQPMVAYSAKANTNGAILRLLAREGAAFDIVSANELDRVLAAGATGDRVIFAGVGKTKDEMARALAAGVREFNVESPAEAELLNAVALDASKVAPIAIRVNPNVDAKTHKHITTGKKENKFGMSLPAARDLAGRIRKLAGLRLDGIHAHIGSQILDARPHHEAAAVLDGFLSELAADGHALKTLNFGGGFGISYEGDQPPLDLSAVADAVATLIEKHTLELFLEPGRSIIGPAGAVVTRVTYLKHGLERTFVIVDAAMTEVLRPALYSAHHRIVPVDEAGMREKKALCDIVGPVCETGDFLAQGREMPLPAASGLLAVLDAGAYCSEMSSRYNSRPRAAEVLLDEGQAHLIRARETAEDLVRHERIPAHLA